MSTLGNQYATGQKIQRPSEDPVVAVRSLKYRTQLKELEQYYEKNIPDARGWMDVTESAMDSVSEILTFINTYCNQGASDTLEVTDRNSIVETLKQYKEQIYQYANSDYAGRYVFTGYRTDTPLLFDEASEDMTYTITEEFDTSDLETVSFVSGESKYVTGYTADQYAAVAPNLEDVHQLRLSYSELDSGVNSFKALTYTVKEADGTTTTKTVDATGTSSKKEDGTVSVETWKNIVNVSVNDDNAYKPAAGTIHYIPETGELILSEEVYSDIETATSIEVKYDKSKFQKGEVRPEHYFQCDTTDASGKVINYSNPNTQNIQYEVNFSQKLTVNTLACDSFNLNIGRTIDEIISSVNKVFTTETKLADIEKKIAEETDDTKLEALHVLKDQVETELTLKKKVMEEKFGAGISMSKDAQNTVNIALANLGSRYVRLELTESRLANQKVDFTEMLEKNDSVEIEEAVINYNAADVTYNASLSAAAKVVTNTLLDFL